MSELTPPPRPRATRPFWRAVARGLGILLPPLLTIAVFIWIGSSISFYLLQPMHTVARRLIVFRIEDVRHELPGAVASASDPSHYILPNGEEYKRLRGNDYIPWEVWEDVRYELPEHPTPREVYNEYVDHQYLAWYFVVPLFLCLFLLALYFLGKLMAAELGQVMWNLFEGIVNRVPLVRSVYGSVKKVTDFMLTQTEFHFGRVVAVEYPRSGCWSLGFVMGDGMEDVSAAANESTIGVLIPTSPAPFTGFVCMFRRSEVVDLHISLDQALQYIVSCGVVVPPTQVNELANRSARRLPGETGGANGSPASPAAEEPRTQE